MNYQSLKYLPQYGFGDYLSSDKSKWMGFVPGLNMVRGVGRGVGVLSDAKKDGGDIGIGDMFTAGLMMSGIPGVAQADEDWIRRNSGTIGKVGGGIAGAALGTLIGNPVAGAQAGIQAGGALGSAAQGEYEMDQAASEQELIMQNQRHAISRQRDYQNALNRFQQSQLNSQPGPGFRTYDEGGKLDPIQATSVETSERIQAPNIRISPKRANSILQQMALGQYYNAVERPLTQTSQNFIYNRADTLDPEMASIYETLNSGPTEFFTSSDNEISRLMPTTQINVEDALKAKQFVSDLYDRGQIQYAKGGMLQRCASGGLLNKYGRGSEMRKYSNGGIMDYSGQTHSGPDGGIPVDYMGNPTAITGEDPVGLVEDNESSWTDPDTGEVYIFSDRIDF